MLKPPLIQPYLFFNGTCEEAVEFYRTALGAKVEMLMRYKDSPEPPPPGVIPQNWGEKIMHASFDVAGNRVMASDACDQEGGVRGFHGFSLSLALQDEAAATRAFEALSVGGKVTMPLGKTFWSPCFGMVTDRFGLGWMVTILDETQFQA
jgi:PhnB protein